ncbi:WD40 repeat domain-containing protein [Treponema bryantii]|uniref:WD40 repeat domain-containing protein n=1 Tax=Treponema bryantii TaxID=163 RepID=UPI0003B5045A|nr:WD40 repeat domain-containing protein [Treponema bryantii]
MKKYIGLFAAALLAVSLSAQSHISTQSHQAQVTQVAPVSARGTDGSYYTVSDDGFVIKWTFDGQGEHYQFSDVSIKLIAVSPNGSEIALYETDGGSINRITVWDWKTLTRKYLKKFSDSITSLSYSSKGTYLIAGTATVDGAVFIRTQGWQIVDKIKANTGIVSYIHTSNTEKTCVFYSPSGSLSFYDFMTGKLKQKMQILKGLSQTVMYDENRFFAGVRDNSIYITASGKTIASIPANNPLIISTEADYNLYYLETDGRGNYEVKMIESQEENKVSNPRLVKILKGPRGSGIITAARKDAVNIYFGGKNGSVYKSEVEATITTNTMYELTDNTYSKIYDVAPADSDFYFLTTNAVYSTSYDTGVISKLISTEGETNIISYKDNSVILWSQSEKTPVKLLNLDRKSSSILFTPKTTLQKVRLCTVEDKDYLVEIESNSLVNLYDLQTGTFREIYSGTGIQDAVYMNNKLIYIAKSAATNPQTPLLTVNPETMETVPLSIKGNVTYALSTDGKTIYGLNIISDETGRNTYVFSFNIYTKQMTNILKFAEEDAEAFTYLNGNNLFTNIGRNKVYCYNLSTKKRFAYNRSASIPKTLCMNSGRAVILNSNGSISWCGTADSKLLGDWYLTKDDNWYEF